MFVLCGTELPDTDQIDVRFGLPDVAFGLEETARHRVNPGLLRVEGQGCYARCLLPVRLSGELLLVLGTWMEISEADLQRAQALWDQPGYADLVFLAIQAAPCLKSDGWQTTAARRPGPAERQPGVDRRYTKV